MKFGTCLAAVLLIAVPVSAADRLLDVAASYVWLDPSSEGTFQAGDPIEDFDVQFDSDTGYGVSLNIFFGRLSTELAVSQVDSPVALQARGRAANLTPRRTSLIPVTATLQYHFAPDSMIDPYVGAGAMYILFGDLSEGKAGDLAVDEIESDDLGYLFNFGLNVELTEQLGFILDAKYVPSGGSARGILNNQQGTETHIRMSPIVVSTGISYRF